MELDQLSNLLNGMGSEHQYLVQDLPNTSVYHYTDLAALQSIVTSRDLWLTNSRFSNDFEEGEHGRKIIREAIKERLAREHPGQVEMKFLKRIRDRVLRGKDRGAYICCFCLEDDLLGQWRSYGANGTGVSIGLDTRKFQWISGPDFPSDIGLIYLWRVFYPEEKQKKIVNRSIDMAFEDRSADDDDRIKLAVEAIRFFAPTFKNPDFQDEREARLIFRPVLRCKVSPRFRVGRGMLVPYYTIQDLTKEVGINWSPPIRSVRIGPGSNREINQRGVKLMLASTDYQRVNVDVSKTPYRG